MKTAAEIADQDVDMENRAIPELRAAFDAVLMAPIASHKWQARRSRSHWVDLEGWQSAIAGPLSSIVNHGECEYVYSRNYEYFTGVVDPATLREKRSHAGHHPHRAVELPGHIV